jgi:septum formation protein
MPRFILASASPRRRELLARHGYFPEIIPADVTEHEDPLSDPREMVLHNAALKANHLAAQYPDAIILGADTTVAIGNLVLNKPPTLAAARAMLHRLSARRHTVFTGVALIAPASAMLSVHGKEMPTAPTSPRSSVSVRVRPCVSVPPAPAHRDLFCVTCNVTFKPLDDALITAYFALVNPLDKAGAYGIQEGRDLIIAAYDEPLSNIMGLPVEPLLPRLLALGLHPAPA